MNPNMLAWSIMDLVQDDAALQKERHILKLKMFQDPTLAAAPAGTKAVKAPAEAQTFAQGPGKAVAKTAVKADSGGSGMFDDVDDAYEVDLESSKGKETDKAGIQVPSLACICATTLVFCGIQTKVFRKALLWMYKRRRMYIRCARLWLSCCCP
jgi:hypothetical protein